MEQKSCTCQNGLEEINVLSDSELTIELYKKKGETFKKYIQEKAKTKVFVHRSANPKKSNGFLLTIYGLIFTIG
ncbi:hypothetical protein [uncultured Kordia sp.]|uniref:hypothetical protein n=1 Tax=uncultured Kordia sp. TaxID=507699 RepID=UPI00261E958D|nr:hypothetical protein [uncultured Kordia sp.]